MSIIRIFCLEVGVKNPKYIEFMFAGIEERLMPPDTEVFCNQCHKFHYVSDVEMAFLKNERHIINKQVNTPHLPKVSWDGDDDFDGMPEVYTSVQYAYVSRFCPHCEREKFGSLSDWRA